MRLIMLLSLLISLNMPLGMTSAQETKAAFDLSATYEVPDLGIMFDYPTGWVADESDGVTLVAAATDLTAAIDNDPTTKAVNPFISLDMIQLDGTGLPPQPRLEDAYDLVVSVLGLTVAEQTETPVMARRAMTLNATDKNGDHGLITFWMQNGSLILFILSTPSAGEATKLSPTWGLILGTVRPLGALPLSDVVSSDFMQTDIAYPTGWTIYNETDRLGIFELSNDRDLFLIGNDAFFTGIVVTALYQATDELKQAGVLSDATLEALLALNVRFLGLGNPQVEEAVVFGEPALTIKAVNSGGFYTYGVMGFVGDHVYFVQATSLDEQAIEDFIPTFHMMMQSLKHH